MGDFYEVQWLAGIPYLVHQSEKTNWQMEAVKLTPEQIDVYDKLHCKHRDEMDELLTLFLTR